MNNYRIHDNGVFRLQQLADGKGITPEDQENLWRIANVKLKDLSIDDRLNLLVFPHQFGYYGDDIGSSPIFNIEGDTLRTGNIMGFIGIRNTALSITSRFAKGSEDFFLHYMLSKIFSINIFELNHTSKRDNVFDFLLYLFPNFLVKAVAHGIIRKYQSRSFNDARVRGRIDVAGHLRSNVPFNGAIFYSTREYSADNEITQLIRHTIEYITRHPFGVHVLNNDEEVRRAVNTIKAVTPTYASQDRNEVINRNRKSSIHPFYTDFEPLQRLCMQILEGDGLKYGEDERSIYGVLFDGAWLWEEYLNMLLSPLRYKHPRNKVGMGAISLFEEGGYHRYPDFMKNGSIADAKYKRIKSSGIDRDDMHQMISYMYVEGAENGYFLFPSTDKTERKFIGKLRGYGGAIHTVGLRIPSANSMSEFSAKMSEEEAVFRHLI